MAYSRPQSIHTHLYMNRSLHWVCMEAYSIAQSYYYRVCVTVDKGVSSPVGMRGHATTVNNEIVMNLFMNLFLVT